MRHPLYRVEFWADQEGNGVIDIAFTRRSSLGPEQAVFHATTIVGAMLQRNCAFGLKSVVIVDEAAEAAKGEVSA